MASSPPRELAAGKLLLDRPVERVVRLTISNPDKRNALDHSILDAISAVLEELAAEEEMCCVVVTGAHGMFSAGYEIDEFADGMLPPPVFVVPSAPRQILAPRVKGTTEAHA